MREFEKQSLLLILGPSGTGKTTIFKRLLRRDTHCILIDADIFWKKEFNAPETNFIEFKRYCLKIASHLSQNGCPIVYFLQGVPDDFEQCIEMSSFSQIHYLFLVCDNEKLLSRLHEKPKGWGLLETNPDHIDNLLQYNMLLKELSHQRDIPSIDTSNESIEEVSEKIYKWIQAILGYEQ